MDGVSAGEGGVRREDGFTSGAEECCVEELEEACLPQEGPALGDWREADQGHPLTTFLPVGNAEGDRRVGVLDRRPAPLPAGAPVRSIPSTWAAVSGKMVSSAPESTRQSRAQLPAGPARNTGTTG